MESQNTVLLENRNRGGGRSWNLREKRKRKENVVLADEMGFRFIKSTL